MPRCRGYGMVPRFLRRCGLSALGAQWCSASPEGRLSPVSALGTRFLSHGPSLCHVSSLRERGGERRREEERERERERERGRGTSLAE